MASRTGLGRIDGRRRDQIRPVKVTQFYETRRRLRPWMGDTKVICTAPSRKKSRRF